MFATEMENDCASRRARSWVMECPQSKEEIQELESFEPSKGLMDSDTALQRRKVLSLPWLDRQKLDVDVQQRCR